MPESLNPNEVTISSIKKSHRVLLSFTDSLITFFLSLFLFSVVAFPVAKNFAGYDALSQEISTYQQEEENTLYDTGLLDKESEESDFTANLTYSSKLYLLSFVKEETEHEYFRHAYIDLLGRTTAEYISFYQNHDAGYFDYTEETVTLKDSYKELFLPLLDEEDTLSDTGQEAYERFTGSYFPELYADLLKELQDGEGIDASSPLYTISSSQKAIDAADDKQQWILGVCGYLSYFVGALITYLVIPLISKRGKTLSMIAFRFERVGKDNLRPLLRKERPIGAVFNMLFNSLAPLVFLPMLYIPFASLFACYPLLSVSLFGLVLDLASFIVTLANSYGRSLVDILTRSVVIHKEDLEKLASLEGFKVAK